jgi:hypothetical protein
MAYVPAVETVNRPVAFVKVIPDAALLVPVAFANASVAAREEAESFVRVKLMN